jgi:serine/threonine-protein kinase
VVSAILVNVLDGLHAAHEAKDERGAPLDLVHRDVSPQNVLVGVDGVARVLDFGIAKAAGRAQVTREGQVKGKLGYMAPEQLRQRAERASDLYACGVCLWEALAMRRLFSGDNDSVVLAKIMAGIVPPPSKHAPDVPPELDAIALRALHLDPGQRFATARDMARAIEVAVPPASPSEVGEWVEQLAGLRLARRAEQIAEMEARRAPASGPRPSGVPVPAPVVEAAPPPVSMVATRVDLPPVAAPAATVTARLADEAAPRPSRRRWAWIAGGGVSIVLATGVFFVRAPRGPGAQGHADVGAALPPPAPAAGTETAAPAALPSSSSGAVTSDEAPAASGPQPSSPATTRPRSRPAGAPKVSCDPPYSVGPDQVRHYKKQCFK